MDQIIPKQLEKMTYPYFKCFFLTIVITIMAYHLAKFPIFSIAGPLVVSLFLGVVWRFTIGVNKDLLPYISTLAKGCLQIGVILLGARLHVGEIFAGGFQMMFISIIHVSLTVALVYYIGRKVGINRRLALLTACGTSICGAAAIVAIAPLLKVKADHSAIAISVVALLGTFVTIMYTSLYSIGIWDPIEYGIFSGATLHEVAHVMAAAAPAGHESLEKAIVMKLSRVLLLIPVALLLVYFINPKRRKNTTSISAIPVPWFVFGFLMMSALHSSGVITTAVPHVINGATLFISMGMTLTGLGMTVQSASIKKEGGKVLFASLVGTAFIIFLGYTFIFTLAIL
ncbi:YeiH family protein [Bacillus alkalicellulosilyticus]|uniref:YeiH family protein n=1 Tax=Alkalihalobacterium alkalicellulosilyticum TaxID=1912214 RepID=UPI000997B5B6|nr:putative sulfate exporter family transporter [Bacillus alkalicellulosilyticus]